MWTRRHFLSLDFLVSMPLGPCLLQHKASMNAPGETTSPPPAAFLAAYGSFAPATANLFADSSIICYVDTATSLISGFVVFSVLGSFAKEHNKIVASNPDLRANICLDVIAGSGANAALCPAECAACLAPNWLDYGACCGGVGIADVAQAKVALAFSVCLDFLFVMCHELRVALSGRSGSVAS